MSRLKHRYTTGSEINHLFANNIDRDIYCNNMNVRVSEDRSYLSSYNTVIAILHRKEFTFIVSTEIYSHTTSMQQWDLRSAIWTDSVIFVPNCNNSLLSNIKSFNYEIKYLIGKEKRARQNKTNYQVEILDLLDNMQKYIKFEKADLRKYGKYLKINNYDDVIMFYEKEIVKTEKEKEIKRKALLKQREKEQKLFNEEKEKLTLIKDETKKRLSKINTLLPTLFHHGKNKLFKKLHNEVVLTIRNFNKYDIFFDVYYNKRDYLKVSNDNSIITSQGVKIDVKEALRFYKFFNKRQLMTGDKVDGYSIRDFNQDLKFIVIGCHIIDFKELDYIGNELEKRG